MKLLLIEDRADTVAQFRRKLAATVELTHALSRGAAESLLEGGASFDLVICDLRIPPSDDRPLDAHVSHGEAVFDRVRVLLPGTPVIAFTAYGSHAFIQRLIEHPAVADILGTGELFPMTRWLKKSQMSDCLRLVADMDESLQELETVAVGSGGSPLTISDLERRVIRIWARPHGPTVLLIEVPQGMSSDRAVRVEVTDATGHVAARAVAKLGSLADIRTEEELFDHRVNPRLPPGSFPPKAGTVIAGAGPLAGLFYGLAANYDTLFEVLQKDPELAAASVPMLQDALQVWVEGGNVAQESVADVRRLLVSDEALQEIALHEDLARLLEIEGMTVSVRPCTQHGDLHGANVLLDASGRPLVIDFASVIDASPTLDPITLEASLLFHPAAAQLRQTWPTRDQASSWADLDGYVKDCPVEKFVRACRRWAWDVAENDRSLFATLYAYAVRQFRFPDTSKDLAHALCEASVEGLHST